MKQKKEILAYWVRHNPDNKNYFRWSWDMIWVLIKYNIFKRKKIVFTVVRACDREEYLVQFFAIDKKKESKKEKLHKLLVNPSFRALMILPSLIISVLGIIESIITTFFFPEMIVPLFARLIFIIGGMWLFLSVLTFALYDDKINKKSLTDKETK